MYLHALATAVPDASFTQQQCWDIVENSDVRSRLSRKSMFILQAVLTRKSGIDQRQFCLSDINRIFDYSSDELNLGFQREAPVLASRALTKALDRAGLRPSDIDALLICTCTGYLCPGVTSYVAEKLGMRTDAFLQDLAGLGCGAAIPTFRAASAILAQNPKAVVACVAVEVCSAAFYMDDDPGVLVSACLFGDGAAATIWRGHPDPGRALRCGDFSTLHQPANRDFIRFEQRNGKLRNLLDATVPSLAAAAVSRLYKEESARPGARRIERILSHSGGRDVLDALQTVLPAEHTLEESRAVLREHGNMSSPSVVFALEKALQKGVPGGGDWWLISFGAGFAAHGCRISTEPR